MAKRADDLLVTDRLADALEAAQKERESELLAMAETINGGWRERLKIALIPREARVRQLEEALRRTVDLEIDETHSAAWHFAEVRRFAREALENTTP